MATGIVEAIGTIIGSTGSESGTAADEKDKVFDGSFTTFFSAANVSGDWVGKDLGSAGVVKKVGFAPRRTDSTPADESEYEKRLGGGKFQVSDDPTFATGVTDIYTIPTFPVYHSLQFTYVDIVGAPSRRYVRYLGPTGSRCNIAEIKFFVEAGGPTSVKPAPPRPYPNGGRKTDGLFHPTNTNWTTSGTTYYRTDATDPTESDSVWPPATLDASGGAVTVRLKTFDNSLSTPGSDVVITRPYHPYGFKNSLDAADKWYDTEGNSLEAHCGEIVSGQGGAPLIIDGFKYLLGTSCNFFSNVAAGKDANGINGINLYRCANLEPDDFYNWDPVGIIAAVPANRKYVIRPHIRQRPSDDKFVLWFFGYRPARDNDAYFVMTSADIEQLGGWADIYPTGMQIDGDGGWDANLYVDYDDVGYRPYNKDDGIDIRVTQLTADYENDTAAAPITAVTGTWEAPAMADFTDGVVGLAHSFPIYYDSGGAVSFRPRHSLSLTPTGTYRPAQDSMLASPVGTVFNAQVTCVLKFEHGLMGMFDYWNKTTMADSRPVFMPYDLYLEPITTFDVSRFDVPANTLSDGLAYCWEMNEIGGAAPVDKVLSTVATQVGVTDDFGTRLRVQVVDSTKGFTVSNSAQVQLGTGSYVHSYLFSLNSVAGTPIMLAKDDFSTNREYGYYVTGGNLHAYATINGSLRDIDLGAVSISTLYLVHQFYDKVRQVYGAVKNGNWAGRVEVDVSAGSGDALNGTAILSFNHALGRYAGGVGQSCLWKGVVATQQNIEAHWANGTILHSSNFKEEIIADVPTASITVSAAALNAFSSVPVDPQALVVSAPALSTGKQSLLSPTEVTVTASSLGAGRIISVPTSSVLVESINLSSVHGVPLITSVVVVTGIILESAGSVSVPSVAVSETVTSLKTIKVSSVPSVAETITAAEILATLGDTLTSVVISVTSSSITLHKSADVPADDVSVSSVSPEILTGSTLLPGILNVASSPLLSSKIQPVTPSVITILSPSFDEAQVTPRERLIINVTGRLVIELESGEV
jgi:hypothetical protein